MPSRNCSPLSGLRVTFDPVERDHHESDAAFRRRRVVAGATLVLGTGLLAWALRIEPGNPTFYLATLGLAGIWATGSVLSGRLHLGRAHTRDGGVARPLAQSLALGTLLLAIFLAGSLIVARIPALREPVEEFLDHARFGSLPIVAALTALNGIAEEDSTSAAPCTPRWGAGTRSPSRLSSTG